MLETDEESWNETPWTWEELIHIYWQQERRDVFFEQYGWAGALAMAVAKWHPSNVRERGSGPCSCCDASHHCCDDCPLQGRGPGCCNGLWDEWLRSGRSKAAADKVFAYIMEKYRKAYERWAKENL